MERNAGWAVQVGTQNTFLYVLTVLIWGSTWLAIEFQLGVVPPSFPSLTVSPSPARSSFSISPLGAPNSASRFVPMRSWRCRDSSSPR